MGPFWVIGHAVGLRAATAYVLARDAGHTPIFGTMSFNPQGQAAWVNSVATTHSNGLAVQGGLASRVPSKDALAVEPTDRLEGSGWSWPER